MKLRTQLLLGFGIIVILLASGSTFTYLSLSSLIETSHWVKHTHDVVSNANHLEKILIDLETGERGFLITGNEEFLSPYLDGIKEYNDHMENLIKSVSDNQHQANHLVKINGMVNGWLENVAFPFIEMRRQGDMESIVTLVNSGKGKDIIDSVREEISLFVLTEKKLLDIRTKKYDHAANHAIVVKFLEILIIVLSCVLTAYCLNRTINIKMGGEPSEIEDITRRIAGGNYDIEIGGKEPFGILKSVMIMSASLKSYTTKLEERISQRTEELQKSNERLEQFAYAASHDLREPLRTISGFADLVESRLADNPDEKLNKYLFFIRQGTERLANLIEDLLSYSRVGKDVEVSEINIELLVQSVTENLHELIKENTATIEMEEMPTICSNRTALVHIFQNLIENAVQYKRDDEAPKISISSEDRENEVLFIVTDNGLGIKKKYEDKVFLLFQRIHLDRNNSGTGAGLAIVKKCVERCGGEIYLESFPGKGTTFFFTIQKMEQIGERRENSSC